MRPMSRNVIRMNMVYSFLYLLGWAFIFAIYGIYTAITIGYLSDLLNNVVFFYSVKFIEFALFLYIGHQFLKRVTFERKGIGQSISEVIKIPIYWFNR